MPTYGQATTGERSLRFPMSNHSARSQVEGPHLSERLSDLLAAFGAESEKSSRQNDLAEQVVKEGDTTNDEAKKDEPEKDVGAEVDAVRGSESHEQSKEQTGEALAQDAGQSPNQAINHEAQQAVRAPAARPRVQRTLSTEDIARFQQIEESRVVLDLQVDDTEDREIGGGDGLKQTEADDSEVEETPFGLPQVNIEVQDGSHRRSSVTMSLKAISALAKELKRQSSRSVRPMLGPQAMAIAAARNQFWMATREFFSVLVLFVDAVYILVSVPWRIGFLYDPWDTRIYRSEGSWSRQLVLLTVLDAAGELCRWHYTWRIVRQLYRQRRRVASGWLARKSSAVTAASTKPTGMRPARSSLFSIRGDRSSPAPTIRSFDAMKSFEAMSGVGNMNGSTVKSPPAFVVLLAVVPFEVAAIVMNPNWLHLARIGKVLIACYTLMQSYSRLLLQARKFAWVQWLSFSTLASPFYLFWLGLYLCHLSACGYMLLATIQCGLLSEHCRKLPIPGSWVLKDNMERADLWRRYIRTMYWASKTVTTLGQGDLVPATEWETNYCIVVQFISGLWATAFLASCSFYFSRRDRDIASGVSTRLEQSLRFLRSRKVPTTLSTHIRNYYQHIQRTRNGIEEEQTLANLPPHYQQQCAFFVKYRLIAKVPFFSKQPKAFLRTVINALDSDFVSPRETVVALFDIEELILVARGDIAVLNQQRELVHVLSPEEWFAEDALFDEHRSDFELEARTFSEIYRLSKPVFITCMERHFPKLRIAVVISQQQQRRRGAITPRPTQPVRSTMISARSARSTRTSILTRMLRSESDSVPWAHPNSRFRKNWRRWKAALLIFLAIEVPFEVAFKWRSGYIGSPFSQQAIYVLAIIGEIFFYADLYLRARRFIRHAPTRGTQQAPRHDPSRTDTQKSVRADMAATAVRKKDDFVTKPREIWRLYMTSDDVAFDVLATLPISIVWNFVNQSSYSVVLRELMRFGRLLALLRLFALKPTLKRIMVEIDWSPASQLLANVIVSCVITANAMACYFYLIADDKDFLDALPYGFDPDSTPVSASQCLEQATLYSNCTWYVYDRSAYSIEARYIRSLHWSLVLLSTVGYGDVVSFTNSECLIGFWWIFLGALICYFTSCAVGSVVSQVMVLTAARDARIEETTRALVRSNVSKKTRDMIRSHYEVNWELNGSVIPEECLMRRLPRSLRQQLATTLYLQSLRRCYVFAGFGGQVNVLREVAFAMTSMIVLPGFTVVEQGHIGDRLYLMLNGDVELLLPLRARRASAISAKTVGNNTRRSRLGRAIQLMQSICGWTKSISTRRTSSTSDFGSGTGIAAIQQRLSPVPMAVLREGDCFGEEGLLSHKRYPLAVTARALTSAQVATLHRDAFLSLADRFPSQLGQMIALIAERYEKQHVLYSTMRVNLEQRDKVRDYLGTCKSAYSAKATLSTQVITPDQWTYRLWRTLHGMILYYNFYQITFRIAFLPYPSTKLMTIFCCIDYVFDAFLYADIYMKYNRFGYDRYGEQVTDLFRIRRQYKKGWLKFDLLSMLPLYYVGDYFAMSLARLPRLLKSPQMLEHLNDIEQVIRERFMKGSTTLLSVFDLVKFLLFFLSAAHHIGSVYFLLGRVLTTYKWASASWMTVDAIITAYPDDIWIQYNRAVYWCLETFTVVCFGDVIARNAVETLYASLMCIIGWMCIGQIVGRITSLMASIDKDMKDHNISVDNFEQYALNRKLPTYLRERAVESVEYKSKCLIDLTIRDTFQDLPQALHVLLFEELYGPVVRAVPELADVCSESQLRVLAQAFTLEIYVADDMIIEEGRLGTKLFVMREGRAEYMSPHSRMVFAAIHEGVIFGDLAFFLTGTRHIASVRASKSCQVLQLEKKTWMALWSGEVRQQLEAKIIDATRQKYLSVSRAYLNIVKNFDKAIQPAPRPLPHGGLLHADMGGSTSSIQSSTHGHSSGIHSSGTDSERGLGRHESNAIPSTPAHSSGVLNALRKAITGTPRVGPQPPMPTLRTRRRHSRRRRARQKMRSKLSNLLGIDGLHARDDGAGNDAEIRWRQHERNLKVLNLVDDPHGQADEEIESRPAVQRADSTKADAEREPSSLTPTAREGMEPAVPAERKDIKAVFRSVLDSTSHSASPRLQAVGPMLPSDATSRLKGLSSSLFGGSPQATVPATLSGLSNHSGLELSTISSSGTDSDMMEQQQGSFASHLENLKMRSQRRQRQSLFISAKEFNETEDTSKNPFEIWVEPPLPPSFCLENSRFRRVWSTIMYMICLYYILIVPFRVSFDFDYLAYDGNEVLTTIWFALEYVMDVLCLVDFVLHDNFFTFVHRGTLVTERRAIHHHYLHEGAYAADLLCILPLELLVPFMPFFRDVPGSIYKVTWYRVSVFRLNKMVRIVHLHALGDKIQRMLVYDVASLRNSVVYFIRFAFDFALGAHWVACLFFGVAFNTYRPGEPSWLTTPGMLTFEGLRNEREVGQVPLLMKYSRSYHFSMGAITTVSYGDIAPQNPWETFIGTFVIVISIVLFGMLSGGFSQVFEMELGKRADYEEKIASVAHFMMFHKFPVRIWKHMQSYFMVHWSESQGMNEEELLSGLPTSVKHDITLFVKQDFIKQMKLFSNCDEAFVRAVVVAFEQEFFVRNDVIISYGERGRRSLYVIERGHVLVRVPKKKEQKEGTTKANNPLQAAIEPAKPSGDFEIVKNRYDFFGEKSLIFDIPRSATCIALSSCSMLILSVEKYEEILVEFPEYRERNMRDWVLANTRENTPQSALRAANVVGKLASKRAGEMPRREAAAPVNLSPSEAVIAAAKGGPSAPSPPPPPPPPLPPASLQSDSDLSCYRQS